MSTTQIRTAGRVQANFTDNTDATRDSRLDFYTTLNGTFDKRLSIDGDGQVGVGTTNPAKDLEVIGSIGMTTTNGDYMTIGGYGSGN